MKSIGAKIFLIPAKEKCYDHLGCISLTSDWTHPVHRPTNLLPAERHVVNTIFVQWVVRGSTVSTEIIGTKMNLTKEHPLKLLIHDFTSNGYTGWIQHLSRILLTYPNAGLHVVSVDWAAGAEPPYIQAIANARLVALEIVNFLEKHRISSQLKLENVHIVGHGVGAHIAGYVGKMNHLKRITALDPSGLYFEHMPPIVRLYKGDADYIEVVHTDASPHGQGSKELLGHVDFFPNGGRKQPGCKDPTRSLKTIKRGDLKGKCITCGDNMEYCLRLNVLNPPRSFNNMNGYFFVTSSSPPFCGEVLKVVMCVQSASPEQLYVNGYFNITVPQPIGDVNFLINENSVIATLRTNKRHTFLVFRATPPPLLLPIKAVYLKWQHRPLPCYWCTPPKIAKFMLQKMSDNIADKPQWFCEMNKSTTHIVFGRELVPCKVKNEKNKLSCLL